VVSRQRIDGLLHKMGRARHEALGYLRWFIGTKAGSNIREREAAAKAYLVVRGGQARRGGESEQGRGVAEQCRAGASK